MVHFMIANGEIRLHIGKRAVDCTLHKRTIGAIYILCKNIKRIALFHGSCKEAISSWNMHAPGDLIQQEKQPVHGAVCLSSWESNTDTFSENGS